jgi:hypothetical protein
MAPRPGGQEGFCLPLSAEAPCSEIPYSTEQGIISEEQQILARDTIRSRPASACVRLESKNPCIALEEFAVLNEARTLRELVIKCTGRTVVFLRQPIEPTCTGGCVLLIRQF